MRAYSVDLREKLLAAVDAGMRRGQAASLFGVSVPTIERYVRLRRETGSLAPRRAVKPGPAAVKGAALRGWLPGRLADTDPPVRCAACGELLPAD